MQIIDSLIASQLPPTSAAAAAPSDADAFDGGGGSSAGSGAGAGARRTARRKAYIWTSSTAGTDNMKSYFRKKRNSTFVHFDDHSDHELNGLHLVKTLGLHPHQAYEICKHTVFSDELNQLGKSKYPTPSDVWIVVGNPTVIAKKIEEGNRFVSDFTHVILDEADYGGQKGNEVSGQLWGTIISNCPDALVTYYSGTLENTRGDELKQPLVQVTYSDCIRAHAVKELNVMRISRATDDGEAPLTIQVPSEAGDGTARIVHIEPTRDREELKEYRKYFARNKEFARGYIKAATDEWLAEQTRTGIPGQFIIFVPPGDGKDMALDSSYLTDVKSYFELVKAIMLEENFVSPLTGDPVVVGMTSSKYPDEDSYNEFCKWNVDILVNVDKLSRSFDDPLVTTILFLRDPGTADTNRKQMIGRGLRILTPGKMKEIQRSTPRFKSLKGPFPEPTDGTAPICLVIETEVQEDPEVYERFVIEEKHDLEVKPKYLALARAPLNLDQQQGGGGGWWYHYANDRCLPCQNGRDRCSRCIQSACATGNHALSTRS